MIVSAGHRRLAPFALAFGLGLSLWDTCSYGPSNESELEHSCQFRMISRSQNGHVGICLRKHVKYPGESAFQLCLLSIANTTGTEDTDIMHYLVVGTLQESKHCDNRACLRQPCCKCHCMAFSDPNIKNLRELLQTVPNRCRLS